MIYESGGKHRTAACLTYRSLFRSQVKSLVGMRFYKVPTTFNMRNLRYRDFMEYAVHLKDNKFAVNDVF